MFCGHIYAFTMLRYPTLHTERERPLTACVHVCVCVFFCLCDGWVLMLRVCPVVVLITIIGLVLPPHWAVHISRKEKPVVRNHTEDGLQNDDERQTSVLKQKSMN